MGIIRRNPRPDKRGNTSGLFTAFLIFLVWLPIPLGSNRTWSWALMEVGVYLMAAVWLIQYARGRVSLTEPFHRARAALILFALWLGFGLLQMIPLPTGLVAAISPHTAAVYQQAHLAPRLAGQKLESNPIARPRPSFPEYSDQDDRQSERAEIIPAETGQPDAEPEDAEADETISGWVDTLEALTDTLPPDTVNPYSTRLTLDLSASLTAWLKTLAYVLLFCLTLLLVDSPRRLKWLAHVLVLSGLGQAVYGSLSLAIEGGGVATGTFMNRNHYAAYLVICLSVGIGLLIASMGRSSSADSWRQRMRHIGALILSAKAPLRIFLAIMVIALVLTHSRMGNSSFFASMLMVGALALYLLKDMPRSVMILIASLIVIDILIIGSWVGLEKVTERIAQTTMSQEHRDEFDIHSFRMWKDYPLFGAGAGSYYSVYSRYRQGDTSLNTLVDHAHNDYIELLTEYGILGMLLPAGVVVLALRNAILAQRRRRSQFARGIGFAATMAITAMLIHATVEFNLQIPAYAATLMVILAMAWLSRYIRTTTNP